MPDFVPRCERVGVVYSGIVSCNSSMEVPLWKIFLWIVEILLCEGGDIEQWHEPRNISWCLRLDLSLSTLYSLYILHCYSYSFLYMLDIACVLTLVFNQEGY